MRGVLCVLCVVCTGHNREDGEITKRVNSHLNILAEDVSWDGEVGSEDVPWGAISR